MLFHEKRKRRGKSLSNLLPYALASMLGCSSSLFLFNFWLFAMPDDSPPASPPRYKFGEHMVAGQPLPRKGGVTPQQGSIPTTTSTTTRGDKDDDYFQEHLPEDSNKNDWTKPNNENDKNPPPRAMDKETEFQRRIEQRRRERQQRNQGLRDEKRLGQIQGGLFGSGKSSSANKAPRNSPSFMGAISNVVKEYMFGWLGYSETNTKGSKTPRHPPKPPPSFSAKELQAMQRRRIHDWEQAGLFWNYSQPAVRLDTTLPEPSLQLRNETLVVLVLSSRSQRLQRQTIRETWGKNHSILFVVGGATSNESSALQTELVQEASQYRDVLDSIHPESYMSLPYKLHFGYQWCAKNVPNFKWILKADADTVVRVGTLQSALLNMFNAEIPMVIGRIIPHSIVNRKGKWAEFQYENQFYPYWAQGSRGHIVSRPIVQYIAALQNLTYYQGEDTSMGIWLDESTLNVQWVHSAYFQNHGQCQDTEALVIGHKLSPDDIRNCFDLLDEWDEQSLQKDKGKSFLYLETRKQRKDLRSLANEDARKHGAPELDALHRPDS